MAEQTQPRALSAAFPTPPPFYKHFTAENVARVKQLRKEQSQSNGGSDQSAQDSTKLDVLALPAELRSLIPPEPPADGRYKSFGIQHDVNTRCLRVRYYSLTCTVVSTKPITHRCRYTAALSRRSRVASGPYTAPFDLNTVHSSKLSGTSRRT